MTDKASDRRPALVLAADHRARGILTVESYDELLRALEAALAHCDGVMATAQPLGDLVESGATRDKRTYLSLNRTGLAGSAFELDDRLVASVDAAASAGHTGVKIMTRIDLADPITARALELLGRILQDAAAAGLEAMVEPLSWREGAVDRSTEGVLLAAVIAHDMGAPLLKVPVPDLPAGTRRVEAMRRVTSSVGVPVLVLGGPRSASRRSALRELADGLGGGCSGAVIGRAVYQDPDPSRMARMVSDLVHGRTPLEGLLEEAESMEP